MRLVVLESPYAGKNWWERYKNIRYARACVRDCLKRKEAPLASHLLYTQRGILKDHIAEERRLGIDAGLAWGPKADATVVYVDRGLSLGMKYGIMYARRENRPVEYRTLYPDRARNWDPQWGDPTSPMA